MARMIPTSPLILSLALLTACASTLRVSRYDPAQSQEGAGTVYFLPKVTFRLQLGLEITSHPDGECSRVIDACAPVVNPEDVRLIKPELISVVLPDDSAGFVLESQGTFVTETEFGATFSKEGELLTANASVTDKSLETMAFGVETLGKLFSSVVMAGASDLRITQQHATRRQQILKAIDLVHAEAAKGLEQGDPDAVLEAKPRLDALQKELNAIEAVLHTTVVLPFACSIEPDAVTVTAGPDGDVRVFEIDPTRAPTCPGYAWLQRWLGTQGLSSVRLPTITVRLIPRASVDDLRSTDDQWDTLRREVSSPQLSWVPGLVYRVPAWFEVNVVSSAGPLLSQTVAVPQLGKLAALTVDGSALRKDRSLEVTLHQGLGSLDDVHYQLSAVDLESAGEVVDAVVNVRTQQTQLEAERLAAQVALIEAQMEYLAAQQELAELKAALEGSEATPTPAP